MPIRDISHRHMCCRPSDFLPFPVKVNVHFPLRGDLYQYATRVNEAVSGAASNEVRFEPSSFQLPHVTLIAGHVESETTFIHLLEATAGAAAALAPIQVTLGPPYAKARKGDWVFMDVNPVAELAEAKRTLARAVGPYLIPLSWDVTSEAPHVTVAFMQDGLNAPAEVLASFGNVVTGVLEAIEVSFVGARGSCLGTIRTYELTQ
jgi:hypothetical protein